MGCILYSIEMGENMKKIITFITIFFIGIIGVSAKEISEVACLYDFGGTYGKYEIKINNYNTDNPTVSIKCQDANTLGYINYSSYSCMGATTSRPYVFFKYSTDSLSFISKYKKNFSCPSLYANPYDSGDNKYVYFETVDVANDSDIRRTTDVYQIDFDSGVEATLKQESKKEVGSDDFVDADEINKSLPKKDDKPCEYDMNFDRTNRIIPWYVKFVTSYDENNNYKETYKIKLVGRSDIVVDLNKDVKFALGANKKQIINVTSDQLKAIFLYDKDDCKPGEEIFHYTYKNDDNQINITTDEQEAYDNSIGHKYDNGAGSKGGTGATGNITGSASDPTLDNFGDPETSCSEVLGETLTALVKEAIKWVRIAGAIIAIVNGMLKLIPAIMSKDAEALNKAIKTCITMAIILVFCVLFNWLLNFIGTLFKWDVSCIV